MSSIRICKQLDATGCGIACVAMLSGRSYEEVKSLLMKQKGWKSRDRNMYTKATDLAKLLKALGINQKIQKSGSWEEITGVAIVGVDRNDVYFHWVIAINDSKRFIIIDPKHGEVLRGNNRIKNKRYKHGKGKSNYLSIPMSINAIKI